MNQRLLNAKSGDSIGKSTDLSVRLREVYSIGDLAQGFGVHHRRVESWAEHGFLGRAHGIGGDARFTEVNVLLFIRKHPREYDLGRVDKRWFRAMVFGGLRISRRLSLRRRNGI